MPTNQLGLKKSTLKSINLDVLLHIFDFLHLSELHRVSGTSTEFRDASHLVFGLVSLSNNNDVSLSTNSYIDVIPRHLFPAAKWLLMALVYVQLSSNEAVKIRSLRRERKQLYEKCELEATKFREDESAFYALRNRAEPSEDPVGEKSYQDVSLNRKQSQRAIELFEKRISGLNAQIDETNQHPPKDFSLIFGDLSVNRVCINPLLATLLETLRLPPNDLRLPWILNHPAVADEASALLKVLKERMNVPLRVLIDPLRAASDRCFVSVATCSVLILMTIAVFALALSFFHNDPCWALYGSVLGACGVGVGFIFLPLAIPLIPKALLLKIKIPRFFQLKEIDQLFDTCTDREKTAKDSPDKYKQMVGRLKLFCFLAESGNRTAIPIPAAASQADGLNTPLLTDP